MNQPYPRRCAECGTKAVEATTVEHRSQVKHDNVLYEVSVPDLPADKCGHCGSVTVGLDADARITEALREQLGHPRPADIRNGLAVLDMSQSRFAELCGFATTTVSRWMQGALMSRSSNIFTRAFFAVPELRAFLASYAQSPMMQFVVWETATAVDATYVAKNEQTDEPQRAISERSRAPPREQEYSFLVSHVLRSRVYRNDHRNNCNFANCTARRLWERRHARASIPRGLPDSRLVRGVE